MTDMSNRHPNEVRDIYEAELAKKDGLIQKLVDALHGNSLDIHDRSEVGTYWALLEANQRILSCAKQLGYTPSGA